MKVASLKTQEHQMLLLRQGLKGVISTGKKGQITVVACASAVGQVLPPTVLFDAKKISHAWTNEEISSAAIKVGLIQICLSNG